MKTIGHIENLTRKTLEAIKRRYDKKREFVHTFSRSGLLINKDELYILGMYNIASAGGGLVFVKKEFDEMLDKYFVLKETKENGYKIFVEK